MYGKRIKDIEDCVKLDGAFAISGLTPVLPNLRNRRVRVI